MNGDSRQVWTNAGQVILSDTSNGNMTIGFTINQGSQDNHIIDLKSSDIAHGMTNVAETDTYLTIKKYNATEKQINNATDFFKQRKITNKAVQDFLNSS